MSEHPRPGARLSSDCARCVGLCCVALTFARSAGFAFDKPAGEPCRHLGEDHACGVHDRLPALGMRGCTAFECFGAGQQVTRVTYGGAGWRESGDAGAEMFAVFGVVRQLHELRWLLSRLPVLADTGVAVDAALLEQAARTDARLARLAGEVAPVLLEADLDRWRASVGDLLRRVSRAARPAGGAELAGADLLGRDLRARDLAGADLRGALLVAADLGGCDLGRADLLGADLRDADVRGADISETLFLTQPQLNAARGSSDTRLPPDLVRPSTWG